MAFTDHELNILRYLAAASIPPAPDKGLPAGDDEVIFDRLLGKATPRAEKLKRLIAAEMEVPSTANVSAEDSRLKAQCEAIVDAWAPGSGNLLSRFLPLLFQAYYEDQRVQQAYQRRPGAPFPQGYEVPQGDWSLLDQVREQWGRRKVPE